MKGAFKTPTLRAVALTAPYMHNGIYRTLGEVVEHYDRDGDVKDSLNPAWIHWS
jgi:cytochrome c peroxidase